MSRSVRTYLLHIHDETEFLINSLTGFNKAGFLADETRKRAFVRSLEVIGEAVKRLPMEFRDQYPQTPWRASAGMRDRLIHGYDSIDYEIVWEAVTVAIPQLAETINLMLNRDDIN
ncbi:MAG: HepT-like ribonuclease domain-containing protein [Blastocatellia bacterium]